MADTIVEKPITTIASKMEYLSEDEIKVILDIFGKLDLNIKDAEIILPIFKKLKNVLVEPSLEPDKKIQIGYKRIELTQ